MLDMPDLEADYEIDWGEAQAAPTAFRATAPSPAISVQDDRDLALVHARSAKAGGSPVTEGAVVENHDTVELLGKKFRIAERVGLMPLLKYASAADMTTEDPRALAAIYAMLKDCIYAGTPPCGDCDRCTSGSGVLCKAHDPGDWQAFENHATDTKAGAEELLPVITQVMEIITGRPTPPRDGSSATPPATRRGSTASRSGARGKGLKH
jgi:hypothetical protein